MDPLEKLKRMEAVLALAGQDSVSPKEVGEIVKMLLQILVKVREDLKASLKKGKDDAASDNEDLGKEIDEALKKSFGQIERDIMAIDKRIARVQLWIDQQNKLTTGDDAKSALELAHDNEDAIRRIDRAIDEFEREPGPPGKTGRMPKHKWKGTVLYFEDPDGEWDDGVDLKGDPGSGGGFFGGWGSGMTDLLPGSSNVRIANGKIYVDQSSGGSTITPEAPAESPDDTRTVFTFTEKPLLIVMNGSTYRENHGWTWDAINSQATVFSPVGTPQNSAGDIYALIQS